MRMWMTDVTKMCRQHLLGEHVEHHMFVGAINKGIDVTGYATRGLLELINLQDRHAAIAAEMIRRGYNHHSPLPLLMKTDELPYQVRHSRLDPIKSTQDLITRCPECAALH